MPQSAPTHIALGTATLHIHVSGNATLNISGSGTVRAYVRGRGSGGVEGITAVLMAPILGAEPQQYDDEYEYETEHEGSGQEHGHDHDQGQDHTHDDIVVDVDVRDHRHTDAQSARDHPQTFPDSGRRNIPRDPHAHAPTHTHVPLAGRDHEAMEMDAAPAQSPMAASSAIESPAVARQDRRDAPFGMRSIADSLKEQQ